MHTHKNIICIRNRKYAIRSNSTSELYHEPMKLVSSMHAFSFVLDALWCFMHQDRLTNFCDWVWLKMFAFERESQHPLWIVVSKANKLEKRSMVFHVSFAHVQLCCTPKYMLIWNHVSQRINWMNLANVQIIFFIWYAICSKLDEVCNKSRKIKIGKYVLFTCVSVKVCSCCFLILIAMWRKRWNGCCCWCSMFIVNINKKYILLFIDHVQITSLYNK